MSDDQTKSVATPENAPAENPAGAAPTPQEAPAPAEPSQPYATFPDAESFQKRVEREARKHLKEIGITDPAEVKSILEEHAKLKEAAEEQKRAQMSELERMQADLQAAKEAREQAELQYEDMRVRNHLASVFAKKGVRNFDYGFFLINKKLEGMGDEDVLDEEEFIDELAQDPSTRAALGIAAPDDATPAPVAKQPATTTPQVPRPPAPGANGSAAKSAMDMSPEEWTAYKQRIGLST